MALNKIIVNVNLYRLWFSIRTNKTKPRLSCRFRLNIFFINFHDCSLVSPSVSLSICLYTKCFAFIQWIHFFSFNRARRCSWDIGLVEQRNPQNSPNVYDLSSRRAEYFMGWNTPALCHRTNHMKGFMQNFDNSSNPESTCSLLLPSDVKYSTSNGTESKARLYLYGASYECANRVSAFLPTVGSARPFSFTCQSCSP